MYVYQKAKQEAEKLLGHKVEIPPSNLKADFALPCFVLAKEQKKSPADVAKELAKKIKPTKYFSKIAAEGPYVNFYVSDEYVKQALAEIDAFEYNFGKQDTGQGKKIIVEYSSPNIAKPMSVGHLRTTIIGDSLFNIYHFLGYDVHGINHLGDWGTPHGKLIVGYKKWIEGNKAMEEKLKKEPIKTLLEVYVRFNEEAEKNPEFENEARTAFARLEESNRVEKYQEIRQLWKTFVELSLDEFNRTYERLGIQFHHATSLLDAKKKFEKGSRKLYIGESLYDANNFDILHQLKQKKIAVDDKGTWIVKFKNGLPPVIVQKQDGSTLYITRDLASLDFRKKVIDPELFIYVVGSEQKLHFQQLFEIAELLGITTTNHLRHVDFGLIHLPGGEKMSTRKGNVIFLEDVLSEAVERVKKIIDEKNQDLENKDLVAETVGIGAIKFADLSQNRVKDVTFDWNKMLDFQGDTGPYLQYTYARTTSIVKGRDGRVSTLAEPEEQDLVKKLAQFPDVVQKAADEYAPHHIATYLLQVAHLFNAFYQKHRVVGSDKEKERVALVNATRVVLRSGLELLGMKTVEEM